MPCKLSSGRYQEYCCCPKNMNCNDTSPSCRIIYPKKKLLTRAVESFYENCAAYNLRHIPYRTETERGACLRNTVKDLFVLFCFVAANSVVLLTILSKIAMHVTGVMLDAFYWIKQISHTKSRQKQLLALVYTDQCAHAKPECPSRRCQRAS